jgi:transposase
VEQKRSIVGESLEPGSSPSAVARRHGIGTGLLYTWRRQLLQGEFDTAVAEVAPSFARVEVMALPAVKAVAAGDASPEPRGTTAPTPPASRMEIVLSGGAVVRVDGTVEEAALRRVLSALSSR